MPFSRDATPSAPAACGRIAVFLPNWIGDAVMATPTLRALRARFADAHVAVLLRAYTRGVIEPCPQADELVTLGAGGLGVLGVRRFLRAGGFETALLLTNSFRTAWMAWLAGVPRRIGYARDGRGWMLTEKLTPAREGRRLLAVPAIDYYLALAERLGCATDDRRMELHVADADAAAVCDALARCGVTGDRPRVLITPGAAFGSAKCYPPEQFAEAADRIAEQADAQILLTAAPDERPILERIRRRMTRPAVDMAAQIAGLAALKALVAACDLLITNDSGPRHIAAALGRAVVSIFGPTDPEWARIDYPREVLIRANVECAPCARRRCPIDHRCMTRIAPAQVAEAAIDLLQRTGKSD